MLEFLDRLNEILYGSTPPFFYTMDKMEQEWLRLYAEGANVNTNEAVLTAFSTIYGRLMRRQWPDQKDRVEGYDGCVVTP